MSSGCVNRPARFFIIPDPVTPFCVSATSQAGPYPGPTTTTTAGRLVPVQSGNDIQDAALPAYEYKLVQSGGVDGSEFIWRDPNEGIWNGTNDIRHFYFHEVPELGIGANSTCIVYSKKHRRKYVIATVGPDTIRVYSKSLDSDGFTEDTWSYTAHTIGLVDGSGHSLAACELADGSILLIRRDDDGEFHAHRSTESNGIINGFDLVSENIYQRVAQGSIGVSARDCQIRVASSGNWIRIVFAGSASGTTPAGYNMVTFVSSDNGATWNNLTAFVARTTGLATDFVPFDLVGFDDIGSFLIAIVQPGTAVLDPSKVRELVAGSATQDGNWVFSVVPFGYSPIRTLPGAIYSLSVAKNDKYVWIFAYYYSPETVDPFDDMYEWTILRSEVSVLKGSNATFAASWEYLGFPVFDNIATYYMPGKLSTVWADDHLFFGHGQRRATTGAIESDFITFRALDWTEKSVGKAGSSVPVSQLDAEGWNYQWSSGMGAPQLASPFWALVFTGVATPFYAATARYTELGVQTPGTIAGHYYTGTGDETVFGPSEWYSQGGCWRFVARYRTGSAPAFFGVQGAAGTGPGWLAYHVRFDRFTVSLYSGSNFPTGGTLVQTITHASNSPIFECRIYIDVPNNKVRMTVFVPSENKWYETSTYPVVKNTVSTRNSELRYGIYGTLNSVSAFVRFYEFQYTTDGNFMHQDRDFSSEYDLFGALTTTAPIHVSKGLYVGWAGTGGYRGDTWTGAVNYNFPMEALFVDSPRIAWRSAGANELAQNAIIVRAGASDAISDNYATFVHDAVAVFGTNNRYIQVAYDDAETFSSPTTTAVIDCTMFGGQTYTITSANRDTITLSGSTFPWSRGDLVGCYAESQLPANKSAKITRQFADNVLQLDGINGDAVSFGFTVGSTIVIYAPYGFVSFARVNERFMRIRVPYWSSTAEGYYTIGTVVAGIKLDIDVPMDWAHTDDEQPNVTTYRTKSGISWAFAEGPPQRTITGRVVGDAEEWRQKFRSLLRQVNYEGKAVVLGADSDTNYKNILLGRVKSGSAFDNAGYYIDSSGYLRPAGDLSLTFVEEK